MRGQAAFEYLSVFSIVLLLSITLSVYSGQITVNNREDMRVSNAINAVQRITEAANIVSTQGKPSQITLSVYIPEEITSIQIGNKTVLMKVRMTSGISDIFASSKSNLQGYMSNVSGTRSIKIIAEGSYVNITEG
jgi:hypothetical protein